jgi:hypothetical protein
MADEHERFHLRVFMTDAAQILDGELSAQCRLVGHGYLKHGSHLLRGLHRAQQGAGQDGVNRKLQRREGDPNLA